MIYYITSGPIKSRIEISFIAIKKFIWGGI